MDASLAVRIRARMRRLMEYGQCLWHAGCIGWWVGRTDKLGVFRIRFHADRLRALGWSDDDVQDLVDQAQGR